MIVYQRIVASTEAYVGDPGPLPEHVVGLEDVTLANLSAALSPDTLAQLDMVDTSYLPVVLPDPSAPASPSSSSVRVVGRIDFMRRFTTPEQIAIQASADPVVKNFLFMLTVIDAVELDNADTQAGVGYLEQHALIAAGRAAQVLA